MIIQHPCDTKYSKRTSRLTRRSSILRPIQRPTYPPPPPPVTAVFADLKELKVRFHDKFKAPEFLSPPEPFIATTKTYPSKTFQGKISMKKGKKN